MGKLDEVRKLKITGKKPVIGPCGRECDIVSYKISTFEYETTLPKSYLYKDRECTQPCDPFEFDMYPESTDIWFNVDNGPFSMITDITYDINCVERRTLDVFPDDEHPIRNQTASFFTK